MARHIHVLKVHHLTLSFPTRKDPNPRPVLDDVDFGIRDGEILGLIGNSGSGKTMTSLAIAGLLPEGAAITGGSIKFRGQDLLTMKPRDRRKMLGSEIGMIFQEPSTALDPLMKIGKNLDEVLVAHGVTDHLLKNLVVVLSKKPVLVADDERLLEGLREEKLTFL